MIIAIDPDIFSDKGSFQAGCSTVLDAIQQAPRRPGSDEVRIPGDRLFASLQKSSESGLVEIDESILQTLK